MGRNAGGRRNTGSGRRAGNTGRHRGRTGGNMGASGVRTLKGSLSLLFLIGFLCAGALVREALPAEPPAEAASFSGQDADTISPVKQSRQEPGLMEVHFLDVAQADAALIKTEGGTMLIDAGEADSGETIRDYLFNHGVSRLDYLVLTHPDADHIGGAPKIIEDIEIDTVFMSDFEKDNRTYRRLIQSLDDKGLEWSTPEPGSVWSLGAAQFTVLGPDNAYEDPNNASVALKIQNGSNTFLFTGDAEEEAEEDMLATGYDLQADVYKAGHHGSRTASSEAFMEAVSPVFAVISCGEDNSYGHPHAEPMNRFRMHGIKVFRTDEQGTVVAVSDGSQITWNCAPSETWKAGEPRG